MSLSSSSFSYNNSSSGSGGSSSSSSSGGSSSYATYSSGVRDTSDPPPVVRGNLSRVVVVVSDSDDEPSDVNSDLATSASTSALGMGRRAKNLAASMSPSPVSKSRTFSYASPARSSEGGSPVGTLRDRAGTGGDAGDGARIRTRGRGGTAQGSGEGGSGTSGERPQRVASIRRKKKRPRRATTEAVMSASSSGRGTLRRSLSGSMSSEEILEGGESLAKSLAKGAKASAKAIGRMGATMGVLAEKRSRARSALREWLDAHGGEPEAAFLPLAALDGFVRTLAKMEASDALVWSATTGLTDALEGLGGQYKDMAPLFKAAEKAAEAHNKAEADMEKAKTKKNWADKQHEVMAQVHAAQQAVSDAALARNKACNASLTAAAMAMAGALHDVASRFADGQASSFTSLIALINELEAFLDLKGDRVYTPPSWFKRPDEINDAKRATRRMEKRITQLESELDAARAALAVAQKQTATAAVSPVSSPGVSPAPSPRAARVRLDMGFSSLSAEQDAPLDPGLHVWCVDSMQLAPVAEPDHGFFCEGDSYVVVSVTESGQARVYFWIGSRSTRAEVTCACFNAMALSRRLRCAAQREEQDAESKAFRALFWQGINLVPGDGASSTLRTVVMPNRKRMYRLVARERATRFVRVDPSLASIVHGTITLVDVGSDVYQFEGAGTSMAVRAAALAFTSTVKQTERGALRLHFASAGDVEESLPALRGMAEALGKSTAAFSSLGTATAFLATLSTLSEQESAAAYTDAAPVLYHIEENEQTGEMGLNEVEGPITRASLDGGDAYVLDSATELFAWIGSASSPSEKSTAMEVAALFAAEHAEERGPDWGVTRVVEGAETYLFRLNFESWALPSVFDGPADPNAGSASQQGQAGQQGQQGQRLIQESLTAAAVLDGAFVKSRLADDAAAIDDDGSGVVNVMAIENGDLVYSMPDAYLGHFFEATGFAVIYSYLAAHPDSGVDIDKRQYIVYFWEGSQTAANLNMAYEMSLKGLLAVRFSETGVVPRFIHVEQGLEPAHFRSIFRDRLVVHRGRAVEHIPVPPENIVAVSARSIRPDTLDLPPGEPFNKARLTAAAAVSMFAFASIGASHDAMTAVEVTPAAASLDSGSAFLVRTRDTNYLWLGLGVADAMYMPAWELAMEIEAAGLCKTPAGDDSRFDLSIGTESDDEDDTHSHISGVSFGSGSDDGGDDGSELDFLRVDARQGHVTVSPGPGVGSEDTLSERGTPSRARFVRAASHSSIPSRDLSSLSIASPIQRKEVVIVEEGDEPEEFWAALGGAGDYATSQVLRDPEVQPRLFVGVWERGAFSVAEYAPVYVTEDLNDAKVALLLAPPVLYVWHASVDAPAALTAAALDLAAGMADILGDGVSVQEVAQGSEPAHFTAHFFGWHAQAVSSFVDPREVRLKKLKAEASAARRALREHMRTGACVSAFRSGPAGSGSGPIDGVRLIVYVCVECGVEVCANCAKGCHQGHEMSAGGRVMAGTWGCGCVAHR